MFGLISQTSPSPMFALPVYNITSCNYKYGESGQSAYRSMSGTSMATPHVAGVVALMLSANPGLTTIDVHKIFELTSVELGDAGKDNTYGWGRVDALAAVNKAKGYKTDNRWETVVKEMEFVVTVDATGNLTISQTVANDVMPATVTIWVDIPEAAGRKGIYNVNFRLEAVAGTPNPPAPQVGTVVANFNTMANYEPSYGFNCGNFELKNMTYTGTVSSNAPNAEVAGVAITLKGKATWPARTK